MVITKKIIQGFDLKNVKLIECIDKFLFQNVYDIFYLPQKEMEALLGVKLNECHLQNLMKLRAYYLKSVHSKDEKKSIDDLNILLGYLLCLIHIEKEGENES